MAARSVQAPKAVPADLTSFVGRRHEVAAVRQLFSAARLVTLTGIGGVGKTRLALRVAKEVSRAFPDGVCVVELASLQDPALLPHTVIDALRIREQSAKAPTEVLCDHVRQRRTLLVLDNCEHLVGAAADLADQVLRAAPGVRILATSRQALRIAGEHVYSVPPLPVPDPDEPLEPGTATRYPSVALFAERSAAVVPGFALTPENEAAGVRLCYRLEGIPLAIELASVRLRVLTVDDLVDRLDDRFELLREGNRNLPARHQTLRALIDWSHDLCTPAEQTLWARASVFAGGFGIDALEAVCTDDALPKHAVLDTVAGLVDKSIFIREEQGNQLRFRMLETIRAYGHARLAISGDEPALARRHRDWYLHLLEAAGDEWGGPQQQEWASRLQSERPNLRRALEYCLSQPGEARAGLRMAAVPWFWLSMGYLTEGRLWLDRALALDTQPSHERAWALATAAYVAASQADEAAGVALSEQARSVAVQLDDSAALAFATHVVGVCRYLSADLPGAIGLFTEALARYSDTDVPELYPDILRMELALTHILQGEVDQAAEVVDELFEHSMPAGESWQFSYALWARGFLGLLSGNLKQADADLREALRIKRVFDDTIGEACTVELLAWTAAAQGDAERAAVLLGGADKLWQSFGTPLLGSTHLIAQREQFEKAARKKIGNSGFDAAVRRGSALTTDDALSLALREHTQPAAETPHSTPALTPREREVADLVAQGVSNKDIAARLVISLRTAEGHVENILTKLGFTTRIQIASWVIQQQADRT